MDFSGLQAFMSGQAAWSTECIDTINFLDHVMREYPSQKYTQIKKSFFQRGEQRFDLGGGVEAFKGVFASLRPVLDGNSQKSLSVNVDVANGTFWRSQELARVSSNPNCSSLEYYTDSPQAIGQIFGISPPQFIQRFKEAKRDWRRSMMKRDLGALRRVGVTATHTTPPTQWTIDEIVPMDALEAKFADPDDRRFDVPDKQRKQISVAAYFKAKYNMVLQAGLPVVKMTKKIRGSAVYLPMDVLRIDANQRYNTKLSDTQTSNMIKFAVTLPKERWAAVQQGVRLLNWANDPYLKHYGLMVNPNASKVKARVLPPPQVHFGAGSKEATLNPKDMQTGRWRLEYVLVIPFCADRVS